MLEAKLYRKFNDRTLVDDLTARGPRRFGYGSKIHGGWDSCEIVVPGKLDYLWQYIDGRGRYFHHLEVTEGGAVRWAGRLMSVRPRFSAGELALGFVGYWGSGHDLLVKTKLDYSTGTPTVDSIVKDILTNEAPDLNTDQSNVGAVSGTVNLTLASRVYANTHIATKLPLADDAQNAYAFLVYENRLPVLTKIAVSAVDWVVPLEGVDLEFSVEWSRNKGRFFDGTTEGATQEETDWPSAWPDRDMIVEVPSGMTAARANDMVKSVLAERVRPQVTGPIRVTGDLYAVSARARLRGGERQSVRANDVIRVAGLVPPSADVTDRDGVRTFPVYRTWYNVLGNALEISPDRPPNKASLVLARQGVEPLR